MVDLNSAQLRYRAFATRSVPSEFEEFVSSPGLYIWRVEQLKLVPWNSNLHGKFCYGDSYLILQAQEDPQALPVHHIFYWIGEKSSLDEQFVVAFMTTELASLLRGTVYQHREVQHEESLEFLGLFKSRRIEYLPGGSRCALRSVTERQKIENPPRLFRVKGLRYVHVSEVQLHADSLNQGDVFVLLLPEQRLIYQYTGIDANRMEKFKANELALDLQTKYGSAAKMTIIRIEDGDECPGFWSALGGKRPVAAAVDAGSDDTADWTIFTYTAWRVFAAADGTPTVSEQLSGGLDRAFLSPTECVVLDTGAEVFLWLGTKAGRDVKRLARDASQEVFGSRHRSAWHRLLHEFEGYESMLFKSKFTHWRASRTPGPRAPHLESKPTVTFKVHCQWKGSEPVWVEPEPLSPPELLGPDHEVDRVESRLSVVYTLADPSSERSDECAPADMFFWKGARHIRQNCRTLLLNVQSKLGRANKGQVASVQMHVQVKVPLNWGDHRIKKLERAV